MLFVGLLYYIICIVLNSTGVVADPPEKIVGGSTSHITYFPYQISIRHKNIHDCGGALITRTHVLTAAHCLVRYMYYNVIRNGKNYSPELGNVRVVVGTHNLLYAGIAHSIKKVWRHEQFDARPGRYSNDIGIITVSF